MHRPISKTLRHYTRRRDRGALAVRPRQTLHLRPESQVPVCQSTPGVRSECVEDTPERFFVGNAYAVAVDPPRREGNYTNRPGVLKHLTIQFLAQAGSEGFRVV